MGVTSFTLETINPWLMSDRMAESRPPPTPLTTISMVVSPIGFTFSDMAAMTFEDANGVAFLGPENPSDPADAQATRLPPRSVTLTTVLLYDALIYTFPSRSLWDFFPEDFGAITPFSTGVPACSATFFFPMVVNKSE